MNLSNKYPEYEKDWDEAEALLANGLLDQASVKIQFIFDMAVRDVNHPQIFKSLLRLESVRLQKDEEGLKGVILRLEQSIPKVKEPARSLLFSVLGKCYQDLSERHGWMGENRTELYSEEQDSLDIDSWTMKSLLKKASQYYRKSLELLDSRQESLDAYGAIVNFGADSIAKPTLYDLLSYRYIDFFKSSRVALADFDHQTSWKVWFGSVDEFIQSDLTAGSAGEIYKQLIEYHRKSENDQAFVFANLARLEYAYQLIFDQESSHILYESALNEFYTSIQSKKVSIYVLLKLLDLYHARAESSYYEEDSRIDERWDFEKVDSLADQILALGPDQNGRVSAEYFKSLIRQKLAEVRIEKVSIPGVPILMSVSHRNVFSLKFRLFKVDIRDSKIYDAMQSGRSDSNWIAGKPFREWTDSWPASHDFKRHSVELKMEPLKSGSYFLMAETMEGKICPNPIFFQVTQLASVIMREGAGQDKLLVLDRITGKPLQSAKVKMYGKDSPDYWDSSKPVAEWIARTNKQGMVSLKFSNRTITQISKGKDFLWGEEYGYPNTQNGRNDSKHMYFFIDRAIYRPGQTMYFKLLYLKYDGKTSYPEIMKGVKVEVVLKDANYQDIGKLELKTSDLGSASGSFVLPSGILKGMYSLQGPNGSFSFRVEEYKRPSFELKIDSSLGKLKLNSIIPVSGTVLAFNGIPQNNAVISYKVYRSPAWFDFGFNDFYRIRPGIPNSQIDQGSVRSDEFGRFTFSFTSVPDPKFLKNVHNYFLEIEATSETGETQEAEMTYRLSEQTLFLSANFQDLLISDSLRDIRFFASNVNGQPLLADYSIKIFKLKHLGRHVKSKYWEKPDIHKYGQEEYRHYFPNDLYKNEDDPLNYPVEELLFNEKFNGQSQVLLDLSKVLASQNSVKFEVEAYTASGDKAIFEKAVMLFKDGANQISVRPKLLPVESALVPGNSAKILFDLPDPINYVFAVWNARKTKKQEWLKIDKKKVLKYLVNPGEEGQAYFHGICVRDNRFYHLNFSFELPWDSKKIKIKTESFRNSLLPGANEKWTFKLELPGGIRSSAELLASMYDASLDKIQSHNWKRDFWPDYFDVYRFESNGFGQYSCYLSSDEMPQYPLGVYGANTDFIVPDLGGFFSYPMASADNSMLGAEKPSRASGTLKNAKTVESEALSNPDQINESSSSFPAIRSNLKETVFFYSDLKLDSSGLVHLDFKMNEALTRWKLQLFAHSKEMFFGFESLEVQTKKPLQIKPYYPRFIRQGDSIEISALVSNLESSRQEGFVNFSILQADASVFPSEDLIQSEKNVKFSLAAGSSQTFSWKIYVPFKLLEPVLLRFQVSSGTHTDGEESIIPVMSNRKLITETWPMSIPGKSEKKFHFKGFLNAFSNGAEPYSYSLEFSSNPVWFAVQALPYMTEFSNECSEQIMSKVFAHVIGSHLMERMPRIKEVLDKMRRQNIQISPFMRNQELKSALIKETPWVLDALNETEQYARISQLSDFNNMRFEIESSIRKLQRMQNPDGSFSWFSGGRPDRMMTQHIITQISHLANLGAKGDWTEELEYIRKKARTYLDHSLTEDYTRLAKLVSEGKAKWEDHHIGPLQLQYLYAVSYDSKWWDQLKGSKEFLFYLTQLKKYWIKMGLYEQGMGALVCHRMGFKKEAELIIESLRQRAIYHPELGMYWKSNPSYYWYEIPIETQSLLIEAFYEVKGDEKICDQMKIWLLKNKQTHHWGSTKSTALAVYALLIYGSDWSSSTQSVSVKLGENGLIDSVQGLDFIYSKKRFDSKEMKPGFQEIQVSNPNQSVAWGGAYVQYWQDLDLVRKSNQTGLFLDQALFKRVPTSKGTQLIPIPSTSLQKGDRVVARCIVKSDRPMEYVHLKLMRGAGLELIGQVSAFEWSGGIGFYKSPGDLGTDIFIPYLPKGTFVLEYDMRCAFSGSFSLGVPSMQCMYAPEFSAIGSGNRIDID